jgi:hypothetical protein
MARKRTTSSSPTTAGSSLNDLAMLTRRNITTTVLRCYEFSEKRESSRPRRQGRRNIVVFSCVIKHLTLIWIYRRISPSIAVLLGPDNLACQDMDYMQ